MWISTNSLQPSEQLIAQRWGPCLHARHYDFPWTVCTADCTAQRSISACETVRLPSNCLHSWLHSAEAPVCMRDSTTSLQLSAQLIAQRRGPVCMRDSTTSLQLSAQPIAQRRGPCLRARHYDFPPTVCTADCTAQRPLSTCETLRLSSNCLHSWLHSAEALSACEPHEPLRGPGYSVPSTATTSRWTRL